MIITGAAGFALAHGGGIDRCGGHNDRKRGGYHVHQWARYCACYPGDEACTKAPAREKKEAPAKSDDGGKKPRSR